MCAGSSGWTSTYPTCPGGEHGMKCRRSSRLPHGAGAKTAWLRFRQQPMYNWVVVGAGFAGTVLAERIASQRDERVLVIDRRPHVGGNAYDKHDAAGILIHQYGPHIFHTNSQAVFDYLSQFTAWRSYVHR